MTWIQTHSGKAFDLLDPKPEQGGLDDICHALAHTNRYSGHVGRWSVAQHSIVVANIALDLLDSAERKEFGDEVFLDGLLHDSHEAYVGDLALPVKRAMPVHVRGWWQDLEAGAQRAIEESLGCRWSSERAMWSENIKRADVMACDAERRVLGMWPEARPWHLPYESREDDRWLVVDSTGLNEEDHADALRKNIEQALKRLGWETT